MNRVSAREWGLSLPVALLLLAAVVAPRMLTAAAGPESSSGIYWRAEIGAASGVFQKLETSNGLRWHAVPLSGGRFAGPAWVIQGTDVQLQAAADAANRFEGRAGDLSVWLAFADRYGSLALVAGIRNEGKTPQTALRAGLRLGLDLAQGNGRLWPAVLRCEKTHFWGAAASTDGATIALACTTPIASWHADRDDQGVIRALTLDLLCPGPLPKRHPEKLDSLAPGESREWIISLAEVKPTEMKQRLSVLTTAPMIEMEHYTQDAGPSFRFTVFSREQVSVSVRPPKGDVRQMRMTAIRPGEYFGEFRPAVEKGKDASGLHTLVATDSTGHVAEALFCIRRPWTDYLKGAWTAALAKPQKASPFAATWRGLFTELRAMHYLVNLSGELQSRGDISEIMALLWDVEKRLLCFPETPRADRAAVAAFFAERYFYNQEKEELQTAIRLFDELASPAVGGTAPPPLDFATGMPLFRVLNAERMAGAGDARLKESYDRHLAFLRRGMDELAGRADRVAEAEDASGDGALLARFASLQREPAAAAKYREAARRFAAAQRSLAEVAVPDCRAAALPPHAGVVPSGIKASPDLLCISAANVREIYAAWHLYLLTGEEPFLRQALEGLGACCQLLNTTSGELRFAYATEPAITATMFEEDPARSGMGRDAPQQVGESYLPMIGGWFKPAKESRSVKPGENGFCTDNGVHEIFACMEEIALTTAYLVERPDGTLAGWNCTVSKTEAGETLIVPADRCVVRMHVKLQAPRFLRIKFAAGTPPKKSYPEGMSWTGPDGVPESLRAWGEDAESAPATLR